MDQDAIDAELKLFQDAHKNIGRDADCSTFKMFITRSLDLNYQNPSWNIEVWYHGRQIAMFEKLDGYHMRNIVLHISTYVGPA